MAVPEPADDRPIGSLNQRVERRGRFFPHRDMAAHGGKRNVEHGKGRSVQRFRTVTEQETGEIGEDLFHLPPEAPCFGLHAGRPRL
jgi:hypothetical protein